MSFKEKFKNMFTTDDEEMYLEMDSEGVESLSDYEKPRTKGMNQLPTDAKMALFEPRTFEEGEEVARLLKERRAAVVNLHRLQRDYGQRMIDFLTGVVFALDGNIQKIAENTILCTPNSIKVEGEITLGIDEVEL